MSWLYSFAYIAVSGFLTFDTIPKNLGQGFMSRINLENEENSPSSDPSSRFTGFRMTIIENRERIFLTK